MNEPRICPLCRGCGCSVCGTGRVWPSVPGEVVSIQHSYHAHNGVDMVELSVDTPGDYRLILQPLPPQPQKKGGSDG